VVKHAGWSDLRRGGRDAEVVQNPGHCGGRRDQGEQNHLGLAAGTFEPRGIKELAAPRSLRIASAMIDLLGTFESGTASERIAALRAVRAESLHDTSQALRRNVARVLMQIMKEIVRADGDKQRQLALAHDFRVSSSDAGR
jgi:hypothetical protein